MGWGCTSDHGATPRATSWIADKTALQLALELRKQSIADALIEHKADASRRDPEGRPLLIWAIESGDWFAANYLLTHGTNVEAFLPSNGRRPIHVRRSHAGAGVCASRLKRGRLVVGGPCLVLCRSPSRPAKSRSFRRC